MTTERSKERSRDEREGERGGGTVHSLPVLFIVAFIAIDEVFKELARFFDRADLVIGVEKVPDIASLTEIQEAFIREVIKSRLVSIGGVRI